MLFIQQRASELSFDVTKTMNITGIQNPLKVDLLAKFPQAIVDAWKVGQLLNATAVTTSKNGQATINISGTLLLAQTQFPVTPGQALKLEVSSLAAMTILRLINTTANPGKADAVPPITISLLAQPSLIKQLSVGLQLTARLPSPLENPSTRTVLELAGSRVAVQLSQPLPAHIGQQLKLEVVIPGTIAALKILTAPSPSDNIPQALRSTLPRQAPLPPLLANLALIANNSKISSSGSPSALPLPQPVVALVRNLVNHLPRIDTINSGVSFGTSAGVNTGETIKQAIAQSGLFLEARLAQIAQTPPLQQAALPLTANIPIDFKGGLLSLLMTLFSLLKASPTTTTASTPAAQPSPPNTPAAFATAAQATLHQQMNLQQALTELLRSVKSGLARLQLNQLVSSAPEEEGKRNWVMELPVRNGENIDLIQLCIEKEKNRQHKKKTIMWSVTLSLSPKGLGPIQVRVSLADEIINTSFWAENPKTKIFIHDNLQTLKSRYRELGLKVGTLNTHEGRAPAQTSADDFLHHTLLDENA